MLERFAARLVSRETGAIGAILAVALGVRLMGVGRGLPYIHEYDEPAVMSYVIGMLQRGDFNPHMFYTLNLYYYMLLPVMYLHYWYLHVRGMLSSPWEIQLYQPQVADNAYWWYLSPASFYLWGRALTSLLGTATVFIVYRIGRAVYGPAVGLLAAALLALAPGAIYYADTVRVDIAMSFLFTLTALAGLGIIRGGRWRDYIVTGLLAGLTISAKPTASMIAPALLIPHLLNSRRTRLVDLRLMAMAVCVPVGIVIGTPYLLINPDVVVGHVREQALVYGGVPSLTGMRHVLPAYLAYFIRPVKGVEGYIVPHVGMGLVPAAAALLGTVVGFHWNRRFHLYLLSFPIPFFLFMSGQRLINVRNVVDVLPFAALVAAVGSVWAWLWFQARWTGARTRGFVVLALIVLLVGPGRDAVALGWTLGSRPDTRAAAVQWLQRHVPPGARVALEQDLRWYVPDLYRLPFVLLFAPPAANRDWYIQQQVDFAVVASRSPLRSLPAVAVFPRSAHLADLSEDGVGERPLGPTLDPNLYVVRPAMPERVPGFPATVDSTQMILEPIQMKEDAVYTETVHLPDQQFQPGSYRLAVAGEWPKLWTSFNLSPTTRTVTVWVGQRAVHKVTLTGSQPLEFTTPAFVINRAGTLPVQIELAFWVQHLQTTDRRYQMEWALRPSTDCLATPDTSNLNIQQFTLEAWVYPEGLNDTPALHTRGAESEAPILYKRGAEGYYLRLVADAGRRVFADLSVAGKYSVGRAGFVPLRKWTHIAATYDGHEARIYLNGFPAPPERNPRHEARVHSEGTPLTLGCAGTAPDQPVFKGLITEVRVWKRVLAPEAIQDEAALRLSPDTAAELIGSWSFQSLVRGSIPDLTGLAHHFNARNLKRVQVKDGPLARPVWRFGELNLLRRVTIEQVKP